MLNDPKFDRRLCGLLFDFDGLMVDTEYPSYQGWTELYQAYGCTLDLETYAKHIGSPGAYDLHGHLESLVGRRLNRVQLQAARRRRYRVLTKNQKLLPGVQGYLDSGRKRGLRIGIVSGSPDTWVESHLRDFGIRQYFDCLVTAGDVSHNKPNPEGYDRALGCLAIRADEAIAFEDSPHGVTAARRAGIYCVAVPNGVTRRLSLEHADRVVPSLAEVPLWKLLRQFANEKKGRNSRKDQ